MVGGFASLGGHKVMVIGTQKGRDTKENILRNFGSAHPEGYRKALRLMRLADKFRPARSSRSLTRRALIPGIGAEERHIAEAIAVNLREMMLLEVPIIAAVIGEGGSGGALGIGVADRVLILENAYYSVISPEGCAAILWKDRSAAAKAAEALKITAKHLLELGLVDEIVPEPLGGAHTEPGRWRPDTCRRILLKHLGAAPGPAAGRTPEAALRQIPRLRPFHEKAARPAAEKTGGLRSSRVIVRQSQPGVETTMLYPLTFQPIFKERVWGGRELERLYHKPLPPGVPIGESWEISDRPGDVSVIANGPLAGKDLRWLMENHARRVARRRQTAARPLSAADQDPRCAGKTLAAGPSARRQGRGTWAASPRPRCGTSPRPPRARNFMSA